MLRTTSIIQETLRLIRFVKQSPEGAPLAAGQLRSMFRASLMRLHREGQQLGLDARDLDDVGYALVALIDETIVGRGGLLANEWMREQLQLAIFGENTAGEGFFVRLESVRRDRARAHVLAVYYVVLCLGFRGRYAGHAEIALFELAESVRLDLERYRVLDEVELAPSGAPPRESVVKRTDGRIVLAIGAAAMALFGIFYAGLFIDLGYRVAALATLGI